MNCIKAPFEWIGLFIMMLILVILMPILLLHDKFGSKDDDRT